MNKTNGNECAFPTQMYDNEYREATWIDGGLSKREYFAAKALQGLLSNDAITTDVRDSIDGVDIKGLSFLTEIACAQADHLIKALNEVKDE